MNKPELPSFLNNIRVILTRPSHAGNVGSAARAMKTMGLTQLYVVAPQNPIDDQGRALASGAIDVLNQAIFVDTLKAALADVHIACALTSRRRELTTPIQTPRALAPELLARAAGGEKIALVFGNETFGLSVEEVAECSHLMTISGNPDYFSLNLAMAVQIVAYELFSHLEVGVAHLQTLPDNATRLETEGFYQHFDETLAHLGYYEKRNGERIIRRIKTLFNRTILQREEIDILRGFLKQIQRKTGKDV
jgi:tRNA/rRNA methyltransferase